MTGPFAQQTFAQPNPLGSEAQPSSDGQFIQPSPTVEVTFTPPPPETVFAPQQVVENVAQVTTPQPQVAVQPQVTTPQPQVAVQPQVTTPQPQVAVQPQVTTPFSNQPIAQTPTLPSTPAPELEPGQVIICRITPAKFDAFIRVLGLLDDKNIINITNSEICQGINNNTAILKTNIAQLVDTPSLNLHILSPKKYIKLFKAIKGNNDIFIIDDVVNSRFIVRSGTFKAWLPKQIEQLQADAVLPDLASMAGVGVSVIVQKDERSQITTMTSESNKINLLIKQNQLKGYSVPELCENSFKQFEKEEISENLAELKLTSFAFLIIPTEADSVVSLGMTPDNVYWLHTKITTSIIDIEVLEAVTIAQDETLLIT